MTKAQTISNNIDTAQRAMLAYLDSIKKFEGIKTVCADVTIADGENGDCIVDIDWIAADGTKIDHMHNEGVWAGKALVTLVKIWKCEPTNEAIMSACAEHTAEVMFEVKRGVSQTTGKPYEIQDFRVPTAIDRAHQRTAEIEEGKA